MSEYAQTAKSIILSFGIGQVLPVDDVRCIIEDYLATPDDRDYKLGKCVACGAKHKSNNTNLCTDHRNICLLCRGITGSKKKLACDECSGSEYMTWIDTVEIDAARIFNISAPNIEGSFVRNHRRSLLYFQWYGIKIFPSRFWPKANAATAARQKCEAESTARETEFLIGEIMKSGDQRIAELTRKLYEANAIVNNLIKAPAEIRNTLPRPKFPYF